MAIGDHEVEAVPDDAWDRLAAVEDAYRVLDAGRAAYARAHVSFLRWTIERGVLGDPAAEPPGSPWWRAVNARLARDLVDATRGDRKPGATAAWWTAFLERPSPAAWYQAHNASVVAGYFEHQALAAQEPLIERFLINVALLRVLYAHALVAEPRLALGRLAPLAPRLGDPRHGMVDRFLNLGRAFPERYPVDDLTLESLLAGEGRFGRLLDYGVIAPRLTDLYAFSAEALGEPRLAGLLEDGVPCYSWPASERAPWVESSRRPLPRLLFAATRPLPPRRRVTG
jgi:hypothetical protein